MPMRRMSTRYTESDLQRIASAGLRGTLPAQATPVPKASISRSKASAAKAPGVAGRNGETARGEEGFVMLPYPISTNRYWRNFKGRMVVSAEATQYKAAVRLLWQSMRQVMHDTGPVCVSLILHPKTTKSGGASKTIIDLDNCIKVALDALNKVAYTDDRQVVRLSAHVGDAVDGGGLSVQVSA